jgi:hypothetical protein
MNARDPATGAISTLRFGSIGYNNSTAPGYYDDRIVQLPTFRREISFGTALGGATSDRFDSLRLENSSGALDYIRDWGLAGQSVEFLIGDSAGIYSSFISLFVGRVEQALFDMTTVEITLRDRSEDLRQPIQGTKYAGSNVLPSGLEGVDDIKGKVKPRMYGQVFNISPILVNTSRLVYQVNDGSVNDIPAVYDKGVSLTRGSDYTSQSDMEANAPSAGQYRAWLFGGYFRLGTTPAGTITADVTEGANAAARTAAQIAKRIVTGSNDPLFSGHPGGISSADVNATDVSELDAKNASTIGIWIDSETTFDEALNQILTSVGAWYGFDRQGKFRMARLDIPDTSVSTFRRGSSISPLGVSDIDIVNVRFLPTKALDRGKPVWQMTVNYAKNWTVQQGDSVAGSVTPDRRSFLSNEFRATNPASDETVRTANPLAAQKIIDTLLVDLASAEDERDRQLAILFGRQDFIECDIKLSIAAISALDIGYGATITIPRFGYDSGRIQVISGLEYNPVTNILTVAQWGWLNATAVDLSAGSSQDWNLVGQPVIGRMYLGSIASTDIEDTIDLGSLP